MTVSPLPPLATFEPDVPLPDAGAGAPAFGDVLRSTLEDATGALERASAAESAFAHGRGGLQEAVLERAQADVVLAVATTAASRAAQSLSAIFNIQV